MANSSVVHAGFTIERRVKASPAAVFKAFSDPVEKARWFAGPSDWEKGQASFDFRVGGMETSAGGPKGGPMHAFNCRYMDIVPGERIVYVYDMHVGEPRISVSLTTIELKADGEGTLLTFTEHGAFLDGHDTPAAREQGSRWLMDRLAASVERQAAAA
jgi:uncharacterized protein YndB with AHSA1/START domain